MTKTKQEKKEAGVGGEVVENCVNLSFFVSLLLSLPTISPISVIYSFTTYPLMQAS